MASTPSNMIPLGIQATDFTLFDTVSKTNLSLMNLQGEVATVIFFICNHCPFVIHVNEELVRIANDYQSKGVSFIAISSNDIVNYPKDSPELMHDLAIELNYPFPYLYDESQEVAETYGAACTPDTYVYNKNMQLVYRGQLDDSRPGNGLLVNAVDLRHALDCEINGETNGRIQKPSIGCGIKWKN